MNEVRTFPGEIRALFEAAGHWAGMPEPAREILQGLGIKLEPFCVPQTSDANAYDLRGFEMLAYGRGGASYGALADKARQCGLDKGHMGVALFQTALLTAEVLAGEMKGQVPGSVLNGLRFSVNVDAAMLGLPMFAKLIDASGRPSYSLYLEASEDLEVKDVDKLQTLLAMNSWLQLALDDSNSLRAASRTLLSARVGMVKADGVYVRRLFEDELVQPGTMLAALVKLRQPGKPFVAEGVEKEAIKTILNRHWDVSAHGELLMQGWHMRVPAPWDDVLKPIGTKSPDQPVAYILPATAESSASFDAEPAQRAGRAGAKPGSPLPRQPEAAFIAQVRREMLAVLDACLPLKKAIQNALDPAPADDAQLLDAMTGWETLEALITSLLRPATQSCLGGLPREGEDFRQRWGAARALLTNLCILYVDSDWAEEAGKSIAAQAGSYFEIPVNTELGIEILSSRYHQATPRLPEGAAGKSDLAGCDRLAMPQVASSYDRDKVLKDVLLGIWRQLFPEDSRSELTAADLRKINSTLQTRGRHKTHHHYLACDRDKPSPLAHPEFAALLKQKVPNLLVIRMVTPTRTYLVTADEYELLAEIISFLDLPNELAKHP